MENDHPKLTPGLARSLGQVRVAGQQALSIIVRYTPARRVLRHRDLTPGQRESYNYRLLPFVAMSATPEAIRRLELDDEVVRVYEDLPVHAYLDRATARVEVPPLWTEGLSGAGVRVAIVDTGIDATHPDFQSRIVATRDVTGEGIVDRHGHGTHCASIAGGSGTGSTGRYRGAAPQASLYIAKVLRADGSGMMSDVMAGVEWAVEQGAQVISLSLGGNGPCDGSDALCEHCEAAVAQGIVVCVAAGNEGPAPYSVGSPGCAREVITIGASTLNDAVADFSSRGPTGDGRVKPDVLFPGVKIVAARAAGTSMGEVVNQLYTAASGTSMATPLAAGVCALLLQAEPNLSPAQVKARLMGTAVNLGVSSQAQGSGRADANRARHTEVAPTPEPPAPTPTPTPAPEPGPGTGQGCLPALMSLLFWKR